MALVSVFTSNASSDVLVPQRGSLQQRPAVWDHPMRLHVRALGVSTSALRELASKLTGAGGNDSLSVAAFRAGTDADQLVSALEQKQELETVSSWRLTAGVGRPISFRAGTGTACRLRVQFSPEIDSAGKLNLRVNPEISFKRAQGREKREYAINLPDPGAFLVSGLLKDQSDRQVLERLYPEHLWGGRELVILVTSGRGQ